MTVGESNRIIRDALVSWYGLHEPHLMVVHCGDARRIALLVLPPETPEPIALCATLMASAPGNALTTDETLARAREQTLARNPS